MAKAVKQTPVTYDKIRQDEKEAIKTEQQKKRILDDLKAIANKRTSLLVKPFSSKPIAHLNQLTPFVKVTLKLPKIHEPGKPQTFRTVEYDEIDIFFNPTGKSTPSYFNNYIKSFDYSYDSGGFKCSLSISDISFDFTDMLLLRFRSFMDTNLTFMDVTFGWTSPEYGMASKKDGIIFQNTVTFQVSEMLEEDSQFEREIKISGTVTSTFPDAAGLVIPYSVFGPYPLVTYNFIKYLYEPFGVQLKLMGLIGGDINAAKPKITDEKQKIIFVRTLYKANLLLGKDPLKEKITTKGPGKGKSGNTEWLKLIFGSTAKKSGIKVEEVFPNPDFTATVSNDLMKIFAKTPASPTGEKVLTSQIITRIYTNENFYRAVKGLGKSNDAYAPGNAISSLVPLVAPILKELRIHPWEATRYFYYTMIELIFPSGSEGSSPKPDYNFLELDFADVIDYSDGKGTNNGTVADKSIKRMDLTNRVLGYKSDINSITSAAGKKGNANTSQGSLLTVQQDPFIKVFGITADSIQVTQATSWDDLLRSSISKVKVNLNDRLSKDEKEEIDKLTTNKIKQKVDSSKDKDQVVEENNIAFVKTMGGGYVAYKFANLSSKLFFASRESRNTMFDTIEAMLKKKASGKNSVQEIQDLSQKIKDVRGADVDSNYSLSKNADKTLSSVVEKYRSNTSPNSLILSIYYDRAGSIFKEGFGENNIVQVYSVRFKNSREGFAATEKRTGNSLSLEFPDVVYFKPIIKNLLDHVTNILPLTDMFDVTSENGNKKITSTYLKNYDVASANIQTRNEEARKKLSAAKTKEEVEAAKKEIASIVPEEDVAALRASEAKNIKVVSKAEGIADIEDTSIRKWNERLKFPISWNSDPRRGNGFLEGDLDADAALMKTAVTNLKRRMIIHSMSYEAELKVLGDPTFCGTYFTDKLIFMKVLMADGRDSIHTGIYQITGYSHSLSSGSYFTTLKLMKRPDLNSSDNPQLMTQMINSLAKDSLYKNVLDAEDVMSFAGMNNDQRKEAMRNNKNKQSPSGQQKQSQAERFRAEQSAMLDPIMSSELKK